MKKIAVFADSMPEFIFFVNKLDEGLLSLSQITDKYHYVNPNTQGNHAFEQIQGREFSDILFASDDYERIVDVYLKIKSRIR